MTGMNLDVWQAWLCQNQWQGYHLDDIIIDTTPLNRGEEFVDAMNYRGGLRSLFILTTGFAGETGEALEHFKKWIRDGKLDKRAAGLELGDALAYLTWLAKTLGFTLEDLAEMNYDKLVARGKKEGS